MSTHLGLDDPIVDRSFVKSGCAGDRQLWDICAQLPECVHDDRLKAVYKANTGYLHNVPELLISSPDIKASIDNIENVYAEHAKPKPVSPECAAAEASCAAAAEAIPEQQLSEADHGETEPSILVTAKAVVTVPKTCHMLPLVTAKDADELATQIKTNPSYIAGAPCKRHIILLLVT